MSIDLFYLNQKQTNKQTNNQTTIKRCWLDLLVYAPSGQDVPKSGAIPRCARQRAHVFCVGHWSFALQLESEAHSGLIPSALLTRFARHCMSVSLLVCLLGRCAAVVYRESLHIFSAAGRVAPAEQHSHRCPVTTLTCLFCHIPEHMHMHVHTVAAPRSRTPRLRSSHRIQSSHSTPFEKMDKVRLAILLSVGTPRHRCAASFHPSGKRMCTMSNGMNTHLSRAVSYSPA
jgi:hypothetical protein